MTGDCHRETESLSSLDRERMHSLSFFESITSYLYINYDYFPSVDVIKIFINTTARTSIMRCGQCFLSSCFPQSVEVAVLTGTDAGLVGAELCLRLAAGLQFAPQH